MKSYNTAKKKKFPSSGNSQKFRSQTQKFLQKNPDKENLSN